MLRFRSLTRWPWRFGLALFLGFVTDFVPKIVLGQSGPHADRFMHSSNCALCHAHSDRASAMRDSRGQSVAPYDLWSGSMMAQSSQDPYWKAVLSAEIIATPSQRDHIVDLCTRCHSPMAPVATLQGEEGTLQFLSSGETNHELASDGVSCTVCHRMSDEKLGTPESFTGGFVFNQANEIYGPHSDPFTMPMQRHVGYTPKRGDHIMRSALCATCHTVITESFDSDGKATHHTLHEQAPYLEWQNSLFNDEIVANQTTGRSCQSCHMPQTDADGKIIATRIAHNPGGRDFPFLAPRSPFGQHTFAGGNVFMTRLMQSNRKALGVNTSAEAFDRVIQASRQMLTENTAKVSVGEPRRTGGVVEIPVSILNLSGHKLPTAYPSRRLWIEFIVRNGSNEQVFASGIFNESGRITNMSGELLASEIAGGPIQSHAESIRTSEEVQVYETIMGDSNGSVTFSLLRGSEFLKDNRLLPKGWSFEESRFQSIQPKGTENDANFTAGGDRTTYALELPQGKYRVEVRLIFQSLSSRYMEELFQTDSPEVGLFKSMYRSMDLTPEVIDTAIVEMDL